MKAKMVAISALVLGSITLGACRPQIGGTPGSQGDIPSGGPWKFYVLGIQNSNTNPQSVYQKAQEGWQFVKIDLVVENMTNAPALFPATFATQYDQRGQSSQAELLDTGGYQREGNARLDSGSCNYFGGTDFLLYPNFRVPFSFLSQIPQNQSPAKLTLKFNNRSFVIDLQKTNSNLKTPFETAPSLWKTKQIGEYLEIPNDVKAIPSKTNIVDAGLTNKDFKGKADLALAVNLKNTGGFNLQPSSTMNSIYGFDSSGHLVTPCWSREDDPNGALPPGSAKDFGIDFIFPDYSRDSIQSIWFVICLESNPANKQTSKTEKCDIYQVNK